MSRTIYAKNGAHTLSDDANIRTPTPNIRPANSDADANFDARTRPKMEPGNRSPTASIRQAIL